MWKIFVKDIRVNREYLLLLLIVLAGISFGFCQGVVADIGLEVEAYVLAVFLSSLIASKLFVIVDETTNVEQLFASLPVTRVQLVVSKYLSSFLHMALAMVVHLTVIHLSMTEELLTEAAFIYRPEFWIITSILLILSDAFTYPFYFRYGFVKGAIIYGFALISFMILTVITINILGRKELVQNFIRWVSSLEPWVVYASLVITILTILGSSLLISINIYKKQDL